MKKTLLFQSKVFLVCMAIFAFIIFGILCGVTIGIIKNTKGLTADDLRFGSLSTVFFDKDGKEIDKISGGQNRIVVSLNDMSKYIPQAFVAIEDERYYQHHGVDIKRTAGAVINYMIPGKKQYGGSTITQQLIKNLTKDDDKSLTRKIREQWRALMLETKYSKDQILELYLNTIYLGSGANGVQAAANTYFDKDAKDLTLAQSALIAGITRYPSKYDPTKNKEASKERQQLVLAKMKELGYINEEEYEKALNEKIAIKKGVVVAREAKQSYFVDTVCEDIIDDLQKKRHLSKADAQKMLFNDGLRIYTTMDSKIQEALDEAYSDDSTVFRTFKGASVKPQSAMVIIDYTKGQIVGIVGGRGKKTGVMTFNRATDAKRQPGSSIKPIAVYGPAIDSGAVTAAVIIDDAPMSIKLPDGKWWSPENSNNGYRGLTTIRKAIENSINVVAVKTWQKIGAEKSCYYLQKFGITSLAGADRNSPAALALGGLTYGVSPLEMGAAYGTIANGGYYIKPVTYTSVEDKNGKVLLRNEPEGERIIDQRAAYILTDMMKGVVTSGTGRSAQLSNSVAAGKTGTTTKNMDRWFVGFTPYYVGATWFGYDKQRQIPGNTNYSAKLWHVVMEKVHKGLPKKDFEEPSGIVRERIDIYTGKLSNNPDNSRTREELFIKGTEPTE